MSNSKDSTEYRPNIGVGTIFKRGASGRYYFEHKKEKITPTSLKTSDPYDAVKRARERFGYLLAQDTADQLREATVRMEVAKDIVRDATRARLELDEEIIYNAYTSVLMRANLGRDRHEDASAKSPLSPKTMREVKGYIRRFCEWIDSNHSNIKYMDQVTTAIADEYLDGIIANYSANTYNRYIVNLRVIWKRLAVKAGLDSNVWDGFDQLSKKQVDAEKVSKRPFTLEQLETVFEMADQRNDWISVAVRIGYETGMRLGDVVTLKIDQMDIDGGYISKRTRKGAKDQIFYVPESLPYIIEWIKDGKSDGTYMFPEMASYQLGIGRKADDSEAPGIFSEFLTETVENGGCGFTTTVEDEDGKKHTVLGFHSLRVANATFSHTNGKSTDDVRQMLGHSSKATTEGYIQEDEETIKARVRANYKPLPTGKLSRLEIAKQALRDLDADERVELIKWLKNGK